MLIITPISSNMQITTTKEALITPNKTNNDTLNKASKETNLETNKANRIEGMAFNVINNKMEPLPLASQS